MQGMKREKLTVSQNAKKIKENFVPYVQFKVYRCFYKKVRLGSIMSKMNQIDTSLSES